MGARMLGLFKPFPSLFEHCPPTEIGDERASRYAADFLAGRPLSRTHTRAAGEFCFRHCSPGSQVRQAGDGWHDWSTRVITSALENYRKVCDRPKALAAELAAHEAMYFGDAA